ncbi:hypothetical protein FIBSPDRAFT_509720 [Athelia psychrophila]|uniref:CinA C-terminal domain-containing protein n=1 Tax=Athelia psychrophila TaxID=1759441 RepID=A0A166JZ57_9AGAM|nr:hypothetical protein FIBSPDRAFT_509720 [Fibularhizoctonia sp. CBS 109695]
MWPTPLKRHIASAKVVLPDPLYLDRRTAMCCECIRPPPSSCPCITDMTTSGETAIAVGTKSGKVATRIVQTGLGGDRERNMVAFAEHALLLLRDVLKGTAELRELPIEKAAPSSL